MELAVESGGVIGEATEQDIRDCIVLEEFAILSVNESTFIQCCLQKDPPYLHILEYQDGSLDEHYRAAGAPLTIEQVISAFLKYLTGDDSWRSDFRWENIAEQVREESELYEKSQRQSKWADWLIIALGIGLIAFIVLLLVAAK